MPGQKTKQKQCVHYWIIDSPDGQTSLGRCKYCGMVQEFFNNLTVVYADSKRPANVYADNTYPSDNHDDWIEV